MYLLEVFRLREGARSSITVPILPTKGRIRKQDMQTLPKGL